jgi:tetratricopeptide (TPR) repeat protein
MLAQFHEDLGVVLHRAGRRAEAAAALKEGFDIQLTFEQEALKVHPESVPHRFMIAGLRFRRGEFAQARAEFADLTRVQPEQVDWWVLVACLDRYCGDENGYREDCRNLLQRFADSADIHARLQAAHASLLGPPAGEDLVRIAASVDHALSEKPDAAGPQWCKGLAEYRAGRFKEALEAFDRCRNSAPNAIRRGLVDCFRAMALERAGRGAEASAALAAALEVLGKLPTVEDGDLGTDCDGWLMSQMALREARAVLGNAPVH